MKRLSNLALRSARPLDGCDGIASLPTKVPHGRWKTMTFLAALRHDRIEAPWFLEADRWREFPPLR
jgi:hypothetical protein